MASTRRVDGLPSVKHSDASNASPLATTGATPFPFLNLPAELRNRVYHFAIPNVAKLEHVPHKVEASRGYLAMSTVCRQARAELQPLVMSNVKFKIRLRCMGSFLETFFNATDKQLPKPLNVAVVVELNDVQDKYIKFDMHPLLLAKAQNRDLVWKYDRRFYRGSSLRAATTWRADWVAIGLENEMELPDMFYQDVEDGVISGATYRAPRSRKNIWTLTVRKDTGHLDAVDLTKLGLYAERLHAWTPVDFGIGVQIRVEDLEEKLVKKYYYKRSVLPDKMYGTFNLVDV